MGRGRPPSGPRLLEGLDGSQGAKKRLRVILEVLSGERGIDDACRELGIGKSAFHRMRTEVLQGVLEELEPKQRGRPRAKVSEESERLAELEKELLDTRIELQAARIREEIALTMPYLLKGKETAGEKVKKTKRSKKAQPRKRRGKKR